MWGRTCQGHVGNNRHVSDMSNGKQILKEAVNKGKGESKILTYISNSHNSLRNRNRQIKLVISENPIGVRLDRGCVESTRTFR